MEFYLFPFSGAKMLILFNSMIWPPKPIVARPKGRCLLVEADAEWSKRGLGVSWVEQTRECCKLVKQKRRHTR